MARLRAAAALALSGRYAGPGRQAAGGLAAWARQAGAGLEIEDAGSDPEETARRYVRLARRADVLFGPYGSGPTRAVAAGLASDRAVLWNHGGSAAPPAGGRLVSVIGPAERYWAGLADVLAADGRDLGRVAVLRAPTGFGRAVAAGAVASLAAAGHGPLVEDDFDESTAARAAEDALDAGAAAVVGCGRIEDDLALGRALAGAGVGVGLVVCGVSLAAHELGDAVAGWLGPATWWPDGPAPPVPLWPDADYPAAQALAAGLVAEEAVRAAGGAEPDALWEAARGLRTRTFLGPFAVDEEGRQVAHAPSIVRWTLDPDGPARVPAWRP